ncbi:hypothetical protein Tco_0615001 [Tanacetum coccineum]
MMGHLIKIHPKSTGSKNVGLCGSALPISSFKPLTTNEIFEEENSTDDNPSSSKAQSSKHAKGKKKLFRSKTLRYKEWEITLVVLSNKKEANAIELKSTLGKRFKETREHERIL